MVVVMEKVSTVDNGKHGQGKLFISPKMIEQLPIEIISCILKHFDSQELLSLAADKLPVKVNEALQFRSLWRGKILAMKSMADYRRCLANFDRLQFCERISFAESDLHHTQMLKILMSMRRVRCLSFKGFADLDDHALQTILQKHGAELRVLDLSGCQYLTNFSLSQIARRCRKLHSLILDGCSFSSAGLEIIANSEALVESLRIMDISKCYLMDTGVIRPLSQLKRLQYLRLQSHEWLNATNLPYILAPLQELIQVDIRNCEDFTRCSVEEVNRVKAIGSWLKIKGVGSWFSLSSSSSRLPTKQLRIELAQVLFCFLNDLRVSASRLKPASMRSNSSI